MFRQALVLLVTTVLASLATRDYSKGRYDSYNSNANFNQFNGYEDVRERDMDNVKGMRYASQPQFGQMIVRPEPQQQFVPGDVGRTKYGGIAYGLGGSGKMRYEIRERNTDFGEFCDDADANVNVKRRPIYRDDTSTEDIERARIPQPAPVKEFSSNVNSNSNNNIIGMKYRRLSHWKPVYVPAPPNFVKYGNVPAAYDDHSYAQGHGDFDRSASYPEVGNVESRWRTSEMGVQDYPTKPLPPFWPGRGAVNDHDYELTQPASSQNLNLNSNTNFIGGRSYDAPTGGIPQLRPRRSIESASVDPAVDKYGDQ